MRIVRLALLAGLMVLHGCKNEPRYAAGSEGGAVDRARLCADGGAVLDQGSNSCICSGGMTWNGIRCDAPPPAPLPEGLPPKGGDPEPVTATDPEPTPAPVAAPLDDVATRLKVACSRAKGTWLEKDAYCHCAHDQVLVGRRCRTLSGNVTDDACLRAVSKGRWNKGVCACEPGLVFSPSRGGCVPKFQGDDVVLRRICESSLNKGKWDAMNDRCKCPEGRVWVDELCHVQERLSSKVVCESDTYRGKWLPDAKACACPQGTLWIDQSCQKLAGVPAKVACENETNAGRWDGGRDSCICPGLSTWNALTKACVR